MRIVWKDSGTAKEYEPIKYRGIYIFGTPSGWEVNIKGDNNLYKNHYCAKNAVDAYFGEGVCTETQKEKDMGYRLSELKIR